MYIAADCCSHRDTVPFMFSVLQHSTCTVQVPWKCTIWNRTVLTVITHKLLLHVQLHNSTAHLVYKYCTNCTVYNWTVLTVITHKLLLHVQLHNSTAHLMYKYCTNRTVYNWTVLTVITHKLLLHVQLHNSTAHLMYKYCTNCTFNNWTVLTVITHKLLLHVQLHHTTAHFILWHFLVSSSMLGDCFELPLSQVGLRFRCHKFRRELPPIQIQCSCSICSGILLSS
jgi:hypothetical protein